MESAAAASAWTGYIFSLVDTSWCAQLLNTCMTRACLLSCIGEAECKTKSVSKIKKGFAMQLHAWKYENRDFPTFIFCFKKRSLLL